MQRVRLTETAHHIKQKTFTHKTLGTCTHVFVRVDRTKKPLESPYEGPYEVIKRLTDRLFQIQIQGKTINISTERLKPAFTEIHATDEEESPGHQEVNEVQNTKPTSPKEYNSQLNYPELLRGELCGDQFLVRNTNGQEDWNNQRSLKNQDSFVNARK